MVDVEPQKISLTDKLIETRNNNRTVNIVNRGVLETTTWQAINELADLYATYFIEKRMTLKTCALIGQYSKDAFAQYVACLLTGNTVLMLEPDFPDRFDVLDDTESEIAIIDKKYLTGKFVKHESIWFRLAACRTISGSGIYPNLNSSDSGFEFVRLIENSLFHQHFKV